MLAARLDLIGYTRQDKSIILKPPAVSHFQVSKRFMDKTQKERILHALQRLEQNVGKVSFAVTVTMFNLPISVLPQHCQLYEICAVKTVNGTEFTTVADHS